MTWFEALTGFPEESGELVRSNLQFDGSKLTSAANGRVMQAGEFSTPILAELRQSLPLPTQATSAIRVKELVADVQSLHQDPSNERAVFQVASQFNCLEMATPQHTPEDGLGIYQNDWTQGPACSIAAGAGTILRNYLVDVDGQIGQSSESQIDCLSEVGRHLGNDQRELWQMRNGYCFPTPAGLASIEAQLAAASKTEFDAIRSKLKVGLQKNTEVTVGASGHCVTQVFCSALPIAYSDIPSQEWNHFPRLILEATYEATFYVALQNLQTNGCNKLYLTLVGGGVFGNKLDWILSAIARSLTRFRYADIDVSIVSYGSSNPEVSAFLQRRPA